MTARFSAGVGSGGARGIGGGGILDWPEPQAKQNQQPVPVRAPVAEEAAAPGSRAYNLAAAAAVAVNYRVQPKATAEAPVVDEVAARKHAFLAGSRQPEPAVEPSAGRVGTGAFAVVRCATGPDGQPVALKTYEGLRDNAAAAEHARHETELAGRLQHPNIIAPRAVRREGADRLVIEMEYAAGGTLGDLVKRAKYGVGGLRLHENEVRGLILGLADGVAYLHGKGICHRDIKLNNVLLDGEGKPRLVDFGCARQGADCVCEGAVQGTVAYMAPEVLRGDRHDGKVADAWALGVLLFNLVDLGEYPFGQDSRTEAELKAEICSQPPRLPSHLPQGCCDLLCRLLDKDPARRMRAVDIRAHAWAAGQVDRVGAHAAGSGNATPRVGVFAASPAAAGAGRPSVLGRQR